MKTTTMFRNILAFITLATISFAQVPANDATFIRGDVSIRFNTRTQTDSDDKPREGATDKYALNLNISNSARFHGTIEQQPYIHKVIGASQPGQLTYALECDVVNPRNPSQTRNIGRMFGTVPVDTSNVYRYADGDLKTVIFSMGTAKGFESSFKGLALGKPPVSSEGIFSRIKKEALNISKTINGKTVTIPVTQYDRMDFQQHILGAGPVQIYPEAVVNGSMIYDYGRTAWYFDGVTVTYSVDGRQYSDRITGNIRWVESPSRATTGEGEYDFDIRVNEPAQTETAVFSGPADESSFFATDDGIPALTGTMKYKDTMTDEKVTSSAIQVDLAGNKLTKQQVMYLAKLLFVTTVVPLNAE